MHLIVVALVEVTAILRPMRLDQMLDRDQLLALFVPTAWQVQPCTPRKPSSPKVNLSVLNRP